MTTTMDQFRLNDAHLFPLLFPNRSMIIFTRKFHTNSIYSVSYFVFCFCFTYLYNTRIWCHTNMTIPFHLFIIIRQSKMWNANDADSIDVWEESRRAHGMMKRHRWTITCGPLNIWMNNIHTQNVFVVDPLIILDIRTIKLRDWTCVERTKMEMEPISP